VENCKSLALTTDFWTSNNKWSYCGITGHWIDSNWKLISITLDCLHVRRHIAAIQHHKYQNRIWWYDDDKWHTADKICCIVTHNAWKMVAATCHVLSLHSAEYIRQCEGSWSISSFGKMPTLSGSFQAQLCQLCWVKGQSQSCSGKQ